MLGFNPNWSKWAIYRPKVWKLTRRDTSWPRLKKRWAKFFHTFWYWDSVDVAMAIFNRRFIWAWRDLAKDTLGPLSFLFASRTDVETLVWHAIETEHLQDGCLSPGHELPCTRFMISLSLLGFLWPGRWPGCHGVRLHVNYKCDFQRFEELPWWSINATLHYFLDCQLAGNFITNHCDLKVAAHAILQASENMFSDSELSFTGDMKKVLPLWNFIKKYHIRISAFASEFMVT